MDEKKRLLMASSSSSSFGAMEKKQEAIAAAVEQQQQQQQKCPRCDSGNTKFCYYNNYSLSQPRHFCKACKRYWTRGGTLRNVPVGGGCRKNKRLKIITRPPPLPPVTTTSTNNRAVNPIFSANNYPSTHQLGFSSAGQLLINGHDFLHNNTNMVSSSTAGGGGEVNYSSSCPSMTSLLASTMIQHQNFMQLKDDFSSGLKPLFSPLVQNGSGLAAAMNKVQGQMNYNMINYPVGNGNGNGGGWNNYLGYQNDGILEEQQVIGLSSSTTDPNYYWSMSNANTTTPSNNWHDPPANINNESSVPSLI